MLSLFCGIDGLGLGFERHGFCVVQAQDKITGGDICRFNAVSGMCEGVIAGPPCQGFSGLNRHRKERNYSHDMIEETVRVIKQARPKWALIENVLGVPDIHIDGYERQKFHLDYAWFSEYSRMRVFQFFSNEGVRLNPMHGKRADGALRGALTCGENLGVEMMRDIQGFPKSHKLPAFTMTAKKRAYGNAVPVPMAEYIAGLIRLSLTEKNVSAPDSKTFKAGADKRFTTELANVSLCQCGCGRKLMGRQRKYSSGACRLRGFNQRQARLADCKP